MSVIKMRCTRVSEYDQGGENMREVQLSSTNRDGTALNDPTLVLYGNLSASFVDPEGADIVHDAILDVTIAIGTPPAVE